ncbi:VanZ family protein [Bacillus cytotoxicus]
MGAYLLPIQTAFITFPIAGFLLLIPFLIWQYRKHGYIHYFRMFILYSLLLYCMAAYYLVILPFPSTFDTCSMQRLGTQHYNLVPFTFVSDFLKETKVIWNQPATYLAALKERSFLQAAFNAILLLPLGVYLRYYFRRNFIQTLCIVFLTSLFFEITQITGFYGMYNCPYRLFDVDDLILNTTSGVIGFWIAPLFVYFLPDMHRLDEKIDLQNKPVRMTRRVLALWLDWLILGMVSGLLIGQQVQFTSVFHSTSGLDELLNGFFVVFCYFIVIQYFTNGKTFGKWLLHMRVKGKGERITWLELLKRYGLLYFGIGGINYLLFAVAVSNENKPIIYLIIAMLFFIFNGLLFLHVLLHMFKRDKRLFYEKISGTYNVITFTKKNSNNNHG